jgi:hypothetical protein
MNHLFSCTSVALLLVALLTGTWFVALPLAFLVSLRYGAGLVLILAIMSDAYTGAFFSIPFVSITALMWYGGSMIVLPFLQTRITV